MTFVPQWNTIASNEHRGRLIALKSRISSVEEKVAPSRLRKHFCGNWYELHGIFLENKQISLFCRTFRRMFESCTGSCDERWSLRSSGTTSCCLEYDTHPLHKNAVLFVAWCVMDKTLHTNRRSTITSGLYNDPHTRKLSSLYISRILHQRSQSLILVALFPFPIWVSHLLYLA